MSGLNPGFTTSNALDAGASSATKNTDLTEGVYEDSSSDMKKPHQGSLLSGLSDKLSGTSGTGSSGGGILDSLSGSTSGSGATGGGASGGILDSLSGSTPTMGYDAHHPSTLVPQARGAAPSKNTTDATGGLFSSNAAQGTQRTADSASQGLQDLKNTAGQYAESAERKAGELGASAQQSAHDAANASSSHTASNTGSGGLLGAISDKVSGVFGSTQSQKQASTFDAGLSSATKSTDLADGIHEDASKGIESAKGATARKD